MADFLTAFRLLLIVPVCWAILEPGLMPAWVLLLLLLLAVVSDYCDGILARRHGTASPGGQLFDHGSDCCFVTAGLACAAYSGATGAGPTAAITATTTDSAGAVPWLLPVLIGMAFIQYVLDSRLLHRQKALRMSALGKWNGILYFVPLFLLAVARLPLPSALVDLLQEALGALCLLLIITTAASIIDRALASTTSET